MSANVPASCSTRWAIETALTLRLLFHQPLRQTEGFLRSLFRMFGLDLSAPDNTTLSRRGQRMHLSLPRVPTSGGMHLIVDSSGLSIVGEGEWAAVKHRRRGTRGWKKLHLTPPVETRLGLPSAGPCGEARTRLGRLRSSSAPGRRARDRTASWLRRPPRRTPPTPGPPLRPPAADGPPVAERQLPTRLAQFHGNVQRPLGCALLDPLGRLSQHTILVVLVELSGGLYQTTRPLRSSGPWTYMASMTLRRHLQQYLAYSHDWRTHLSLDKDAPVPRAAQSATGGTIIQVPHVGGLHHHLRTSRRLIVAARGADSVPPPGVVRHPFIHTGSPSSEIGATACGACYTPPVGDAGRAPTDHFLRRSSFWQGQDWPDYRQGPAMPWPRQVSPVAVCTRAPLRGS